MKIYDSRMKFYGLKNCDSCRKAVKELEVAGITHTYVDVRADGVPVKIIENWLKQIGPEILVNKRSTTWRGLSELEKAQADTSKAAKLLAANRKRRWGFRFYSTLTVKARTVPGCQFGV